MGSGFDKEWLEKYLFDENVPEEEITKRQWQIIDAAVKIFSEKGFEGSRTSEIAREADVAEGTIFRYYKTKKDLLVGLLLPLIIKFFRPLMFMSIEKIMENKQHKSIDETLADVFSDRITLAKKNMPLVKTMLLESAYHPEILEPIQKGIVPKVIPIIDKFVEDNIKTGELRELEPRLVTRSLMSSIMGYIILSSAFPDTFGGQSDEEEIKKVVDILLHGIKRQKEVE